MTDKARKPDNTAIKTPRAPVPVSLHQLPSPSTGMYSPTASYSLSPDLPHHAPHPHMPYPGMMHSPFPMPHPLSINNDLGPPIFMPSLNLGTPKSSSYTIKSTKGGSYQNADSSPQGPVTTFSNIMTTGGPFQSPGVMHPSQLTYSSLPNKQQATGQVKKLKLESGTSVNITRTPSPSTPQPTSANTLMTTGSIGTSHAISPGMNLVKPTLAKPNAIVSTSAGNSIMKQYPVGVVSKGDPSKGDNVGFEPSPLSRTDSGGVVVTTLASGISGNNALFCTEGLPPPLPRHVVTSSISTSSVSTDTRIDRVHQTPNHYPGSSSDIPRPEAVSRNIIIPAQSLTGKDIANLTSSSSPLNPNDHTSNDSHHATSLEFAEGSSSDNVTTATRSSPIQSPPHMAYYDNISQQVVGVVGSGGQGNSSPRPSILKKRPFDKMMSDVSPTIPKLASTSMLKPATDASVEAHSGKEHFDIASPRKRPRKQHFDSIMDSTHNSQLKSDSSNHTLNKITSPTHHSLLATERLSSPVPLKRRRTSEEEKAELDQTSSNMIYLTQLKRPQYQITHNVKLSRSLHNHFKRPADIKHTVDHKTPVHEMCNQTSTWLRSSGWKLEHVNRHLEQIKNDEQDVLNLMEGLELAYRGIHKKTVTPEGQDQLEEIVQGNIVRSRRTLLHLKETQETMNKVLEVNPKVVEIMKKYSTNLPVPYSITSTTIERSKS